MNAANAFSDSQTRLERLSAILTNLQTWWLTLIGSGFVLAILAVYRFHRKSPDALQLSLIATAAIFLMGILLSTLHTERRAHKGDDPLIWLARIRCVIAMGVAALICFAAAQPANANPGAIAAVGVLTAGAAWISGLLLGFIFGLPQPHAGKDAGSQATQAQSDVDRSHTESQTNLEQIADWLTKLLVGAGLTQIAGVPRQLDSLASYIGRAMGDTSLGDGGTYKLFALALCIFFSLCGFLYGYLWGRLFMPGAFRFDPFRAGADDARNRQQNSFAVHGTEH